MNSERAFDDFFRVGRTACRHIENINVHDLQALLGPLIDLLSRANQLAQCSIEAEDYDLEEGDINFPQSLDRVPDDIEFHVVFDPLNPDSVCSMSVKDGLGDIYKSLMAGFQALEKSPQNKMAVYLEWQQAYRFHWGRHLVDIIRFLILQ